MSNAAMPRIYKVYTVRIYNAERKLTWKYEVAAPDRRSAQDSGTAWIAQYEPDAVNYRVAVMRQIEEREPRSMYVVVG